MNETMGSNEEDLVRSMRVSRLCRPVVGWAWISMAFGSVITQSVLVGPDSATWARWVAGASIAAEVGAMFFTMRAWRASRG